MRKKLLLLIATILLSMTSIFAQFDVNFSSNPPQSACVTIGETKTAVSKNGILLLKDSKSDDELAFELWSRYPEYAGKCYVPDSCLSGPEFPHETCGYIYLRASEGVFVNLFLAKGPSLDIMPKSEDLLFTMPAYSGEYPNPEGYYAVFPWYTFDFSIWGMEPEYSPIPPIQFEDYFLDQGTGGPFDLPLSFLKPTKGYTMLAEFKKGEETVYKWFDIVLSYESIECEDCGVSIKDPTPKAKAELGRALRDGGCLITAEGRTDCNLYDIRGRFIESVEVMEGQIYNPLSQPKGIYFLKDKKTGSTVKFVN